MKTILSFKLDKITHNVKHVIKHSVIKHCDTGTYTAIRLSVYAYIASRPLERWDGARLRFRANAHVYFVGTSTRGGAGSGWVKNSDCFPARGADFKIYETQKLRDYQNAMCSYWLVNRTGYLKCSIGN